MRGGVDAATASDRTEVPMPRLHSLFFAAVLALPAATRPARASTPATIAQVCDGLQRPGTGLPMSLDTPTAIG